MFPRATTAPSGSYGRPEGASGVSPELNAAGQATHGGRFRDTYPSLAHASGQGPYVRRHFGNPSGQQGLPQRPAWPPFPSQRNHDIGERQRSFTGERKSKFDDKVATAANMKYEPNAKLEWSKTIRNYLISKALEVHHLLNWAENVQSTIISNQHIQRLIDDGFCLDSDPMQLPVDLWGDLNLSMARATDQVAFDNALPGNCLDASHAAWRRIVTPLGPRSEARLHNMHKDVTRPTASRRLAHVIPDLEKWERKQVGRVLSMR